MGINAFTVQWLARLAHAGALPRGGSWVELGPQDLLEGHVTLDVLRHAIGPFIGGDGAEAWRIFADPAEPSTTKTMLLYQSLGAGAYSSVDLFDPRATYRFDLNRPFETPQQFDVLTNLGTSEHCFNIAESFHACHRLLRAGGIGLYILPAFGDINHGFFNIHPMLYPELARFNDYELIDLLYVDDVERRSREVSATPLVDFDFAGLPIDLLRMMNDKISFSESVMANFIANCVKRMQSKSSIKELANVYDHCYVAMRKRRDAPFAYPV